MNWYCSDPAMCPVDILLCAECQKPNHCVLGFFFPFLQFVHVILFNIQGPFV